MEKKNYITGIGGVFLKSKDPKQMNQWYADQLKMNMTDYGASFRFIDERSKKQAVAQFSFFSEDTKYFDPSTKETMLNFRVRDIEEFVEVLKKEGVQVLDEIETFDYGKFVHILDPEGNKIELWEPVDAGFGESVESDSKVNY
ncbi:MAG: VOC family protein [Crocinitomicaceae bacterium]